MRHIEFGNPETHRDVTQPLDLQMIINETINNFYIKFIYLRNPLIWNVNNVTRSYT